MPVPAVSAAALYDAAASGALSEADWVKSTFSHQNGACVELAGIPGGVALRDSKDVGRPALCYTYDELAAFIAGVKAGEFDCFL
ncbi:DUF397 domain-containing protein [Yinghuangia soli]|uniref:DUF397 domain-containing protein n=1 Tax=Yinghuangia soli TaxID=2908204 RepID=A0AA41Q0K7_9ACTN|nr:DUF397 domain-containing protein [Yinghuangia soli]MCF2529354.1 DUF397 domain-containing protein [Yinghuangia soli]